MNMLIELLNGIEIEDFIGNAFYFLLAFIFIDILTGLLRAAKDRKINSSINFDGLIRKFGELLGIVFATLLDVYLGTDGIITKSGVGLLILYEVLSITENFKQIGVNFDWVMKYFDDDKYQNGKKQ